jgi:hypothetical protein
MKKFIQKYIYIIPYILLVGDLISLFVNLDNAPTGEIIGYSLFVNIIFFDKFYYGNYCFFTRFIPFAMTALNIVNIIGFYSSNNFYRFWYIVTIFSLFLTVSIIFELKKKIQND